MPHIIWTFDLLTPAPVISRTSGKVRFILHPIRIDFYSYTESEKKIYEGKFHFNISFRILFPSFYEYEKKKIEILMHNLYFLS